MKCNNCNNFFNKESYAPRVLGCGHTMCHFCISTILKNGEMVCMFCDHTHKANGVTDIPINFTLLKSLKEENSAPCLEAYTCAYHKEKIRGFCKKCKEFVCPTCFDDLHRVSFGCVEGSLEDGFASLSLDPKVGHLSDLIDAYSQNLTKGESKVAAAKMVETAFKECLWSVEKDRKFLELYYGDFRNNLSAMISFKEHLLNIKSLNEFKDSSKKLDSLHKISLDAAVNTNPELLPSSAHLWKNFPAIIYMLRESLSRSDGVFAINSVKKVGFPLIQKGENFWISFPQPLSEIPSGALSFEVTPEFRTFVLKILYEISITWTSNTQQPQVLFGGPTITTDIKTPYLTIVIDSPESIPDEFRVLFMDFLIVEKSKQYVSQIHQNFVYIQKLRAAMGIHLRHYNNNHVRDDNGRKVTNEYDKYILLSAISVNTRRTSDVSVDSTRVDTERGCPILAFKDNNKNVHFVIMKFPINYVAKEFEIIGYCKDAPKGDLIGNNIANWSAKFKIW